MKENRAAIRQSLFNKLSKLSRDGPIPAISRGDTAVGMTLLDALGIDYSTLSKPNFHGIVVTAHRRIISGRGNRVNLFAQVPDWTLSACKSSRAVLERYGYLDGSHGRRLYCSVSSQRANSRGLILEVERRRELLMEVFEKQRKREPVVTWRVSKLKERLLETHPESVWVKAVVIERDGREFFHYREATYAGPPNADELLELLEAGTITVDHLIGKSRNRVYEKGPLFKIYPANLELLFSAPKKYDLMTMNL